MLPFEPLSNDSADHSARVKSLARSLAFDLSAASSISCAAGDEVAPDAEAAVAVGRAADAQWVVWGTVLTVGDRVRIAAQVVEVATAKSTGRFKLTGTTDEWFDLQDTVSERVTFQVVSAADRNARQAEARRSRASTELAPVEVPPGAPLRLRGPTRAEQPPDWAAPAAGPDRYGEVARRQDGRQYWNGGYGGRWQWRYRGARFRWGRYTYRGLPDGISVHRYGPRGLGRFLGPVPLRWFYR